MLVSFSVKNYRSFAERQTLSLVAGVSSKKNNHFSFETSNSFASNLLRSSCVFGANGSGKTSLIKAMDFVKRFIVTSAKGTQEGDKIDVINNLFCSELQGQPSEFEIIFIHGKSLYQYGFAADKNRVWEEWLFAKPNIDKSRNRALFQRKYDEKEEKYIWDINNTFIKGEKEVWKKSTRSNVLFLSQAVQLNAEDLKEPFDWIQKYFKVIDSVSRAYVPYTAEKCESGLKGRVLNLMQSVGIKIQDINIESKEIVRADLPNNMSESIKDQFVKQKLKGFKVTSLHKGDNGDLVPLDLSNESDGTQVLFGLAGVWFDALENGYTLIVDELHNSLHPHALKVLIDLFHNPKINKHNAQVVFTSHETSVMTKGFMHQDQVWFSENSEESTKLRPLSDYKVRDITNFQKAYLDGRYGGIPQIKDLLDV